MSEDIQRVQWYRRFEKKWLTNFRSIWCTIESLRKKKLTSTANCLFHFPACRICQAAMHKRQLEGRGSRQQRTSSPSMRLLRRQTGHNTPRSTLILPELVFSCATRCCIVSMWSFHVLWVFHYCLFVLFDCIDLNFPCPVCLSLLFVCSIWLHRCDPLTFQRSYSWLYSYATSSVLHWSNLLSQ